MMIAKEMVVYTGASVVEKAVPLMLLPILTRLLDTAEYGQITLLMAVVTVLTPIIGLSLEGFIRVVYHKESSKEFPLYVGNVGTIFVISFLAIFSLSLIWGGELSRLLGWNIKIIYYGIATAGLQFLVLLRLVIYQTSRNVWGFSFLQLSRAFFDLMLVLALVVMLKGGAEERIQAYFLSFVASSIFALVFFARDGLLRLDWNKSFIKRGLKFSLPLVPHTFALAAVFTVDRFIISLSTDGLDILGVLGVAVALSSPALILANSINRAFMPWSFEQFRKNKDINVVAVSYFLWILMSLFCVIYTVVLWWGFDLIVGERYLSAKTPTILLVWIGWFKLVYYLVAKGVVFSEKMRIFPVISISIGLGYLLSLWIYTLIIGSIDILVISWLMLSYHFLVALVTAVVSQKIFYQPWFDFASVGQVYRKQFTDK